MTKETARDIAIAMIGKTADNFDIFALDDADIIESEKYKVLKEIQLIADKMIMKIQKKYNINLPSTTDGIVAAIIYE